MRLKSKETTVNIKSWLNVMCGLMWGNGPQMSHCHIKASLLFGGRFCKCLEGKRPSSRVGIFPWLPSSLSPATVRLHNLRKLMVLGIRSSCWQALISESVLPALWSTSPQFTSPVCPLTGLSSNRAGKVFLTRSQRGVTHCASAMMPAHLKWL